jgi:ribosomal protein S18 acetylase RimI-like enzyme
MTVRDYREADRPAVRACFVELQDHERALDPRIPAGELVADGYLEGLFQRCARYAGRLYVAEAEGRVVGFVSVLAACVPDAPDDGTTPYAYVDDLVVLESHRGRGLGQDLLGRAEAYAAACGRSAVRLRVKGGNDGARAFYARAGYAAYEVELEKRLPD